MSPTVNGQCLCGAVRFGIAGPYRWFAHCHCSMCRKHHGSVFGTGLGVARAALRWVAGTDAIAHYRATEAFERPFCRSCGSTVPGVSHDERYWHVPAGLLDGDVGARPRSHIFFASRSPLVEIGDTLAKHAAYPPGIGLPAVAAARATAPRAAAAGSCLCGAVAFASDAVPRRAVHCYCSLCRRSRAAAFATTLPVPRGAFRWLRGAERVASCALPRPRRYVTSFCARCGSLAPSERPDCDVVLLPAGAIDTPLPDLPAVHLCVASKAAWCEVAAGGPQFAELPPPEELTELLR